MVLGVNKRQSPQLGSQRAVTSLRWSVLPQDAERLCVQELARSPSSSCQDRGVCRERNPVRQSIFSGRLRGSRHCFLDRSGGSSKASLSSAHQPQHCQPLTLSGFSTDTASFPIHFFFQETLPDEPVRPTYSRLSSDFYTWMISPAFPGFPNSEDKYCPPYPHQLQRGMGSETHRHP